MTLRQKVAELIGHFDGLDAAERPWKREQLVTDLLALLQNEAAALKMQPNAPAMESMTKKAG